MFKKLWRFGVSVSKSLAGWTWTQLRSPWLTAYEQAAAVWLVRAALAYLSVKLGIELTHGVEAAS